MLKTKVKRSFTAAQMKQLRWHEQQQRRQSLKKRYPAFGKAHPLLDELQSPLVLGDFQQLHGSSLVGSIATNLTDRVADKLAVLGQTLQKMT